MEDTLWGYWYWRYRKLYGVLILVLMEDTLWEKNWSSKRTSWSLNPCFNGRYSLRQIWKVGDEYCICLNPCFNGRYSLSNGLTKITPGLGLNPCFNGRYSLRVKTYVPFVYEYLGYVQAFRNAFVNIN